MEDNNPLDINPLENNRKSINDVALDRMKNDLLTKATERTLSGVSLPSFRGQGGGMPSGGDFSFSKYFKEKDANKIDLNPNDVDQRDLFKKIGGEMVSKFPVYYKGIDNNEYYAQNQSWQEQLSHGVQKLALKTGTATIGNLVGFGTGIFNAIDQGSLHAMYTDDFNTMLDEYNEKLDYTLPNYYTEEERNNSFIESMGTTNFWANDVLGGLSFTLGMIVSEGIWGLATGGTSLIAKGTLGALGRWSTKMLGTTKALKGISKFKQPTKQVIRNSNKWDDAVDAFSRNNPMGKLGAADEPLKLGKATPSKATDNILGADAWGNTKRNAILGAQVPKVLNQARFIMTSAGYEAGVEARHYMKEAEEEFIMNFQEQHGRMPNQQELADAKLSIAAGGNAVFGANMALVGSSNIAVFGKMLLGRSVKPSVSNSWVKRNLFGIGYNKQGTAYKALDASKKQKIAGKVYSPLKYMLVEGVYEEGGQAVAANAVKDYVLAPYDADATQETMGIMDSVLTGLKETYGTKEGRKEVGIGMIIGLIGGGLSTGGRFNEISKERENVQNLVNYRSEVNPERVLASLISSERFKANNRIYKASKKQADAIAKGDITGEFVSEQQAILASIERDAALQGLTEGITDFEAYLDTLNNEELAEELDMSVEEVAEWKSSKLTEYKELSDSYKENEKYVRAVIGDTPIAGVESTEQIIKAITYNMTLGKQSHAFTKKIVEDIKLTLADEIAFTEEGEQSALDVDLILSNLSKKKVDKYMAISGKMKNLEKQKANIESELVSAQYNKSQSDPQVHKAKLTNLQEKIIQLDKQMAELQEEKEVAYRGLGIKSDTVTEEDLDNQAANVKALEEKVEGYKESNPELYTTLTKLISEYNRAKANTISFNNLTKELLDPKLRATHINGWLSGLVNKNKTLDEHTAEFFNSQLEQYEKNRTQGKVSSAEAVKDRTQTDQEDSEENQEQPKDSKGDEMELPALPSAEVEGDTSSVVDNLKNKISEIMKGSAYTTTYIGNDYNEAVKAKPSQTDISRYEHLLRQVKSKYISKFQQFIQAPQGYYDRLKEDTGISEREREELKELQRKLSNWKVLEGSLDSSSNSIADLLTTIEQLETEAEKSNTKEAPDSKDYETMKTAVTNELESEEYESASPVQSPDQVVAKVIVENNEKKYVISHLDIENVARLFPNSSLDIIRASKVKPLDSVTKSTLNKLKKKKGQRFILNTQEGAIEIEVGESARLKISKKSLDNSIKNSNIALVKYNTGNFVDIYERLENGDLIPLQGDFNYKSEKEGEVLDLDPEVINNVTEGQVVITRVNVNDSYNKSLIEEYKSKAEENPEEAFSELMKNLHIYITDTKGRLIGSLRAGKDSLMDNDATKNLLEIRRKAANMIAEGEHTGEYFSLEEAMPVKEVLVGSPNFVIKNQGNGFEPTAIDFTDTALDRIEDVGYFEGETLNLRSMDSEKVIKIFLPKKSSKKMPIVVVKVNGKNVAFPVSLKSEAINKVQELDDILATQLSQGQKAIKVNQLLLDSGFNPKDYVNRDGSPNIQAAREALENAKEYPNVVDWVQDTYNLSNLKNDAQIAIDLDNKPFNLSKVILDIEKSRTIGKVEQQKWNYDKIEDREIQLRKNLQEYADKVFTHMNEYPDVDDVRWTDVLFAEGELTRNPQTDVQRRKNVNLLRAAITREDGNYHRPPKAVVEAHGAEYFEKLRADLSELDRLIELKKKTRAAIKNAELNNQKNQQNKPCKA